MERVLRKQVSLTLDEKTEPANIDDLEARVNRLEDAVNKILRILKNHGYIGINNSDDYSGL